MSDPPTAAGELPPRAPGWLLPLAALAGVALLLLVRLSGFGIWDPWELNAADLGRRVLGGEDPSLPHAGPLLVSAGFALLGVDEWTGRLPIALCGVLCAWLTYLLVCRHTAGDRRSGLLAVLVLSTSPLFVFNARAMLGDAPAFAAQAAIALSACGVVLPGPSPRARWGWLLACAVLCGVGVMLRGALLVVLPPLLAAGAMGALAAARGPQDGAATAWHRDPIALLWLGCAALLWLVTRDVVADQAALSPWTGGQPQASNPPPFDAVIGRSFHAFAPWSALLPLAFAHALTGHADSTGAAAEQQAPSAARGDDLKLLLLLWVAAGYGAQVLFASRYGDSAGFLPVTALAGLVALFLRDLQASRSGGQWAAGIAALLLAALLVRDYAMYPESPVRGMPLDDFSVPDVFNPRAIWGALLGAFGLTALLALSAAPLDEAGARPPLRAPYRLVVAQFRRGLGFKLWLGVLALALLSLLVLGILAWAAPDAVGLTIQGKRWLRRLLFVPPALPLLVACGQLVLFAYRRFYRLRLVPLLLSGLAVGVYAAQGFMPALSAHFSPREVYDTYNALAQAGEALGEYKVGGRAATYYAEGEVVELDSQGALLDHLSHEQRRWAVLPADELASADRLFRRRNQRHLFVADARSARVVLVANRPVKGRKNESFLANDVLSKPPEDIQHPLAATFEKKIEFLGYDLELPHGDHVGAGESFEITWYFRALSSNPGSWEVFVHIDGRGKRIHGDHEPLDGKYPVRLWDKDDVVVDRQRLEVPSSYPAGDYTIYLGFYRGEQRLKVSEGPNDGADRVIAGVLRIR